MNRLALLVFATAALSACTPPPEAPTDLSDLSLFLFAEFDNEDPLVMQAGVVNMLAFLEGFEADGGDLSVGSAVGDRAWSLPVLDEANWGGAPHWDGHLVEDQLPVAVAARSEYGGAAHAELVGLADQTPLESSSSAAYDRTFVTSFDDWLAGDVDSLETSNEIHRQNILLDLVYTAFKDYRWVELPDDGGMAVVSRSWITEQYINDNGVDTMDFFSNVELTVPSGDGTLRYNALWGAVIFDPALDETVLVNTARNGIRDGFQNTEDYLAAN